MRRAAGLLLLGAFCRADERLAGVIQDFVKSGSPGCAVAVGKEGKPVASAGYGLASLEHNVPITRDTAFYAGSVSKQFTAAAIVILAKQGKLSLDAPVRQYVPDLPEYAEGAPAVRQLLHHTSGLRESYLLLDLAGWRNGDDVSTEEDVMALVRRIKSLNFAPGSQYSYSNTGYILLGRIVKAVTGKSLRAFAEENIFRPHGMTHTMFRDDHFEVVPRLAMGYIKDEMKGWRQAPAHVDTIGAGGLITTVGDLAKWDAAAAGLLDEPFRLTGGKTIPYRRGIVAGEYRGLATISHGGALAGYRAHYLRFPSEALTVAVLCNSVVGAEGLAKRAAELFLASPLAPEQPGGLTSVMRQSGAGNMVADYAGRYTSEELGVEFDIQPAGGALEVRRPRNRRQRLENAGKDAYRAEGLGVLEFERDAGTRVTGFHIAGLRFTRLLP